MSQPSVTAFFNSRKRPASDDIHNKAKVLVLDRTRNTTETTITNEKSSHADDRPLTPVDEDASETGSPKLVRQSTADPRVSSVVRNIQFDCPKTGKMTPKAASRLRVTRSRKFSIQEGQTDIRETFMKMNAEKETKVVPFEKLGALSPKKKCHTTPTKATAETRDEQPAAGSVTPKKSIMDRLAQKDMSLGEIKNKIIKSSRLEELKARIQKIRNCDEKLQQLEKTNETKKPQIKKFNLIELELPVR